MRASAVCLALMLHGASAFAPQAHPMLRRSVQTQASDLSTAEFTLGVLGDLHLDPRDLEHSFEGREHMKTAMASGPNKFVCSLGDLGESKDCTNSGSLFAGTTECFNLAREFLDGFEAPFDVVGGNHDLEGIDEFETDEANLEAYLRILGKETPQFCHEIADKTLVIGLGSTQFRTAPYTSHEVAVSREQVEWFEKTVAAHPWEEGWKIFVFSHAPIIGSGLRVLQENHVVNGCCWLNHNDKELSKKFIEVVRNNHSIKGWFSGHFHLSHDYEDSITFPNEGSDRGSCVFVQTNVMTSRSSRDGRRQTRLVRGTADGFEICTVNHKKGGEVRLDATVTYTGDGGETIAFAHPHEDFDHDKWFQAYTPSDSDGCYVANPDGTINPAGSEYDDLSNPNTVCWWHMKDGAVLGVHNGMVIEYDPVSLAPLGMVVSRDELLGKRAAVIDDGYGGSALVLYSDDKSQDVTVVQPNEDGSYWRKVVRNKMHRMREQRRVKAAKKWITELNEYAEGEEQPAVLSSYGPYTSTVGQVMGVSTAAIDSKKLYKQNTGKEP